GHGFVALPSSLGRKNHDALSPVGPRAGKVILNRCTGFANANAGRSTVAAGVIDEGAVDHAAEELADALPPSLGHLQQGVGPRRREEEADLDDVAGPPAAWTFCKGALGWGHGVEVPHGKTWKGRLPGRAFEQGANAAPCRFAGHPGDRGESGKANPRVVGGW